VGCYPVHLAALLFRSEVARAEASATWSAGGVDEAMRGFLAYQGGQALLFSCGMSRPYDTFTRIVGSEGEMRVKNPYHPQPGDSVQLRRGGTVTKERPTRDEHSFSAAIRHIHAVLRSEADPRYLARETALPTALALEALRTAAQRDL
jgi:predicted dehydrogenase